MLPARIPGLAGGSSWASARHPGAQSVPRLPPSVVCSGSLFTPKDNSLKKTLLEEVAFLLNYSLDWL